MGNYDRDYHLRMQMQPRAPAPMAHHHHTSSFPQQPPPQFAPQTAAAANVYRGYSAPPPTAADHARIKAPTSPLAQNMAAPYFHQLLDSERRANPGIYAGYATGYADASAQKRAARAGVNTGNASGVSYLPTLDALPFAGGSGGNGSGAGYQSPPAAFDPDHPLPDSSADWFFGRLSPPHGSSATSATTTTSIALPHPSPTGLYGGTGSLAGHGHVGPQASGAMDEASTGGVVTTASSSRLGGIGGLPSPNGMFNVDALLPDYESSLYSLWNNNGNGAGVLGYEQDNEQPPQNQQPTQQPQQTHQQSHSQPQQQRPTSPHMYMSPEDELKMDYPGLSEFNQGELDYLYDPMESGGPSPTTPLGTTTGAGNMSKLEHFAPGVRGSTGREPHVERLVSSSGSSDYLNKRDHSSVGDDGNRMSKKPRGAFGGSFSESNAARLGGGSTSSGFRSLARNATIEAKRPMGMTAASSAMGSFHGSLTAPMTTAMQQQLAASTASSTAGTLSTSTTTPTAASSGEGGGSTTAPKRPRSRQCDFPGCTNRARSHQKCKKHGGAHQCVFDGCTKNSQSRGLCIAHGGGSRCKVEGCVRAAQSKGLCKSHGGGEFCAVEGCRKKAHLKHLCRTHGGGVRCKFTKCSKWAQRKGWCMAHAKEFLGA